VKVARPVLRGPRRSNALGLPDQEAFSPTIPGPLADGSADPGERVAMMELFKGAIGVFKNPSSHRPVNFDDPTLAAEVVLFADLLLRLLDRIPPRASQQTI